MLSPGVLVVFKYWQFILKIKAEASVGWRGCHFACGRIRGAEVWGFTFFFSMCFLLCTHGPCEMRENLEKSGVWTILEGFSGPFSYIKRVQKEGNSAGYWDLTTAASVKWSHGERVTSDAFSRTTSCSLFCFLPSALKLVQNWNVLSQLRVKIFYFKLKNEHNCSYFLKNKVSKTCKYTFCKPYYLNH